MSDKDSWPKSAEAYKFGPVIGEGSTATVYEAVCIPRNERCAVKCINMEQADASFMDEIAIEISAMARCDHPNVVQYYASFIVKEELWIVMRILDAGSVLQILKRKIKALGKERAKHGVLDETTVCTILRKTLKGLEYLHANGHVHRDIKAGNILLSQDGTLQIGDFGVSALLAASRGDNSRKKVCHTFVGTPCWMAPEVMEQENGYDFKADIWSLGILAVELATGYAPYFHHPPMKVVILTLRDDPPTLDTNAEEKDQYKAYGKTLRSFIADCLQKDPEQRPTATGLLKHPLMKKAKGEKYLVESLIDDISTVPPLRHSSVNKQPAPQVDDQNENWQFDFSGAVAASSSEESS